MCFPVADGRLVVGSGAELLAQGKQKDIEYMAGATSEDMMPPIIQNMARRWCDAQRKPSYVWHFDRQLPGDDKGAWHSSDLWYWFGTMENCWRPMEIKDDVISELMVSYLCNFVRSGDPNADGLPHWEAAAPGQKTVLCVGECHAEMRKPNMLKLIRTMLTNKPVGE